MRFVHVVFDLDGTLVDTTACQTVALNEILISHGRRALASKSVRLIAGHGLRAMLREAFHVTGDPLKDQDLSEALDQLRTNYNEHLLELTIAAPALSRTLRELSGAGVAMTVLSNKPQETAIALLDHVDATEHVAFLVAGDMGYDHKPDPRGLLELMRAVDSDEGNTLLCGSMRVDMQTARNGAVKVAACSPFVDPSQMLALGADYMLHELAQLVPLCTGGRKSGRFVI
jgi:phosphoglycolate phosphatase